MLRVAYNMDVIQMTPDDKKAIQQIMETHSPDAKFDMDKKSFLSKARDILSTATPNLSQVVFKLPSTSFYYHYYIIL